MNKGKIFYRTIVLLSPFVALYAIFAALFMQEFAQHSPLFQKFIQLPAIALSHFLGGGIAIVLGLLLFNERLRTKHLDLHKGLGSIYFLAVFISGIAGIYMGLHAHGGMIARVGFTLLACIWLITAMFSLKAILQHDIVKHRFWVYLNYALTLAALSLRIELPLGVVLLGFDVAYPLVAWMAWVPNLIIGYRLVKKG